MNHTALSQIENSILQLPVDEQLLLISRVAERLRGKVERDADFETSLAEMANDENIRRELKEIEEDFRQTEFDGLTE
ncbi:MAG TPA: hypothetical protein VF721_20270 [Pyrinomonadaceae bacterium]|jgi:hypothetical protein